MRRTVALLLMLSAATACRMTEHFKRAAASAATSFVLQSLIDLQGRAPLSQSSVRPVLRASDSRLLDPAMVMATRHSSHLATRKICFAAQLQRARRQIAIETRALRIRRIRLWRDIVPAATLARCPKPNGAAATGALAQTIVLDDAAL